MNPNIFMDDFECTEWGDSYYAVAGRALAFAARFEKNAKSLSVLVKIRRNPFLMGSDEEIEAFFANISKTPLAKHLKDMGLDEGTAGQTLKDARLARNEVAHELALGMDRCVDLLPEESMKSMLDTAKQIGLRMAKGDAIICLLMSAVTSKPIPSRAFLDEYPERVVTWISEI
jgi:hypothetical protein